jgi:hypothetical protein
VDQRSVTELARSAIAQVAPDELPLFEAMTRVWFKDPRLARVRRGGDETLGFGLAEVAPLLTPIVLATAGEIAKYLAEELGKSLAHMTADGIVQRIGRLFRREPVSPALTQTQLSRIHDVATQLLQTTAVTRDQSSFVADALVGLLSSPAPDRS